MVSVEKAVIAKMSKGGLKFELLVDPVKAMDMKTGREVPLDDLLPSQEIFEDSKKGLRASSANVGKAFGTTDIAKIANIIVKDGDVQILVGRKTKPLPYVSYREFIAGAGEPKKRGKSVASDDPAENSPKSKPSATH